MSSTLSQVGKIALWTGVSIVGVMTFLAIFLPGASDVTQNGKFIPTPIPSSASLSPAPQIPVPPPAPTESAPATNPLDRISSGEKIRLREIIPSVMQKDGIRSPEIYREFWGIMTKMKLTQSEYDALRLASVGAAADYQKLFWEDAMTSFQTSRPFKSNEREQLEKRLQEAQLVTNFRIQQNDDFIEKVARREPIDTPQGATVMTDVQIRGTLGEIGLVASRLDWLFTPPTTR